MQIEDRRRHEIIEAVKSGAADRVAELLAADAGLIGVRTDGGESLLLTAVYYGARPVVDLLLSRGVRLDIFEAAAVGDADRLRAHLEAHPESVNDFSHDGWTPLHLAAFFGREEAARTLLEAGADVTLRARNRQANTPLHAALASRKTALAKLLLEHGAEQDVPDDSGYTPLLLAAGNGNRSMVEELIARGVNLHARNQAGQTARMLAEEKGHLEVAEVLTRSGG